jgi:hypothetical protein
LSYRSKFPSIPSGGAPEASNPLGLFEDGDEVAA